MRRSFGFGGGGSNMGGGRGGGSVQMLRSIQRVCKAGGAGGEGIARPPNSTTGKYSDNKNKVTAGGSNSSVLTLSSSTSSPSKTTASAVTTSTWPACQSPTLSEDESDGWEFINEIEQQNCFDDVVFGRPPSSEEVQQAFQSLHGFIESAEPAASGFSIQSYSDKGVAYHVSSPTGSLAGDSPFLASSDWEEPSAHLSNSRMLSPRRMDQGDVYNAVILLQKDHDIQQIVESISTDKAVWDAVKNNEVVRELRRAYLQAEVNSLVVESDADADGDSTVESNGTTDIITWVVTKVKSKIMDLMNNITKILDQLLHHGDGNGNDNGAEKNADHFDKKVKLSLVVTVALFLAVVLQRMKLSGNSST